MSKILMVIAPMGYQDDEFEIPRNAFINAGHEVIVATKGAKEAAGALGGTAKIDIDISDVKAADYDAVVFIGGGGSSVYFLDENAQKIAVDSFNGKKVVAAICISPSILANAGILKGKEVTAFPSEEANLRDKGADFAGTDVEVDGNIVTASGPPAAKAFATEIMKLLPAVSL